MDPAARRANANSFQKAFWPPKPACWLWPHDTNSLASNMRCLPSEALLPQLRHWGVAGTPATDKIVSSPTSRPHRAGDPALRESDSTAQIRWLVPSRELTMHRLALTDCPSSGSDCTRSAMAWRRFSNGKCAGSPQQVLLTQWDGVRYAFGAVLAVGFDDGQEEKRKFRRQSGSHRCLPPLWSWCRRGPNSLLCRCLGYSESSFRIVCQ